MTRKFKVRIVNGRPRTEEMKGPKPAANSNLDLSILLELDSLSRVVSSTANSILSGHYEHALHSQPFPRWSPQAVVYFPWDSTWTLHLGILADAITEWEDHDMFRRSHGIPTFPSASHGWEGRSSYIFSRWRSISRRITSVPLDRQPTAKVRTE